MVLIKLKLIQIFSNGSLNYSYDTKVSQVVVYEKDNKNFYLNKKKSTLKLKYESS